MPKCECFTEHILLSNNKPGPRPELGLFAQQALISPTPALIIYTKTNPEQTVSQQTGLSAKVKMAAHRILQKKKSCQISKSKHP